MAVMKSWVPAWPPGHGADTGGKCSLEGVDEVHGGHGLAQMVEHH
jgi:hypothetical protein